MDYIFLLAITALNGMALFSNLMLMRQHSEEMDEFKQFVESLK